MSITAKITSKGQITLPKVIREFLRSQVVEFDIHKENVIMKPVKSVGGSLAKYSKGKKQFKKIRDEVWQEVADEKAKYSVRH